MESSSGYRHGKAYAHLFKYLIIGDSGVGKTSILARFCDNMFSPTFISTVGIDFRIRTIEIDGVLIKLQIWDTAGQERFRAITSAYYRGATGIFLVYDVTSQQSFDNIKKWIKNINDNNNGVIALTMIGNKADLEDKRAVPYETAKAFAKENKLDFYETSAKNSQNIENAFINMSITIKNHIDPQNSSGKSIIVDTNKKSKDKCC